MTVKINKIKKRKRKPTLTLVTTLGLNSIDIIKCIVLFYFKPTIRMCWLIIIWLQFQMR